MSKKSKKRQHRCSSINEYRNILYIYNPQSAMYFQLHGLLNFEMALREAGIMPPVL